MRRLAAVLLFCAVPAAAKSPAPEWLVEMNMQERIARVLSENCTALEFHYDGYDRHILEMMGRLSDMQVNGARPDFAPIPEFRKQRHTNAFLAKHGLVVESSPEAFCAAGEKERVERSPVGLMLRLPR